MNVCKPSLSRRRRFLYRVTLSLGAVLVGLLAAEVLLAAFDLPRFYKRRSSTGQFAAEANLINGQLLYVNKKSAPIRFQYDGNPRGYFGPDNEIEHLTNSLGFRGPEFQFDKAPGTLRLMFLGDSFTFGEGVRFEDTYPEIMAALLRKRVGNNRRVEAFNFGVGGYNTHQSLSLLGEFIDKVKPDLVVLGYVLNDAEPPLFAYDPATKSKVRRPREWTVPEGLDDGVPPDQFLYRPRTSKLVWQFFHNRGRSPATIAHYRRLYETSSVGWQRSRLALKQIVHRCKANNISFCVVLFPILYEMTDNYPFSDIHQQIAGEFRGTDATFVDLFPKLKGMEGRELWVHPTDQHPNELVHAIAGKALVDALKDDAWADRDDMRD